jgi:pimeloyl-ACP methyl ester carboxylesterase
MGESVLGTKGGIVGRRRRWRRIAHRRFLSIAIMLSVAGSRPSVRIRASAAAVMAEALGASFPRPFAANISRGVVGLRGVTGDLYGGDESWPAIVLVPGAAPDGKDDARVVRLARALARAERTVFVPQLALADKRFETADIDALVAVVEDLGDRHPGRVTLLGFSYGGSYSLLAAADRRLDSYLGLVATFGAYFDLIGVAQAVTSGVSVIGDRRIAWEAHPRAVEVFREVVLRMNDEGREDLQAALEGRIDPGDLGRDTRAVYEFVTNTDAEKTFALATRLPRAMIETLERFSPATVAARIRADVLALHSTDDPVVPYGEALRLQAAVPGARLETVSLFSHVTRSGGTARGRGSDLLATWRFATRILSAHR